MNNNTAYFQDSHRTLYNKSCTDMSELQDNSVQCVVTSPPYWGLRKYDGAFDLIWGGDKECEHQWEVTPPRRSRTANDCPNPNTISAGSKGSYYDAEGGNICQLCGAWKGSYGLEPTPELYIQHTIEILREIRRVLRKDGVVFWNIGDSYASNGVYIEKYKERHPQHQDLHTKHSERYDNRKGYRGGSIKAKDLCLIPFRVAISAQEDGWWVRSDIIWHKPNPMPESVTDRPTNSHEHILMLTKSSKYYWDADVVREGDNYCKRTLSTKSFGGDALAEVYSRPANRPDRPPIETYGRNLRDVWTITTQPYKDAHFATFPEKIPETCIKASTSEAGCCSKCGSPYERVVEHKRLSRPELPKDDPRYRPNKYSGAYEDINGKGDADYAENITLGWQPTCKCNADKTQCIVLDPFAGSGTTLAVAAKLNRKAIGYELSKKYCDLIINRNRQGVLNVTK